MEKMNDYLFKIEKVELLSVIMEKKNALWRLVQICCAMVNDQYEITYSFANGYEFENFRLIVDKDEEVPSISRVYNAAIFYENEMHELFGLNVSEIKTNLKDRLYRIDAQTPFKKEANE
ncbi:MULTISPECIES: NADH-quinone oxidoreductase subunit C [Agathobacter]|uniref:NADH:ubiquinone oxidoreductase 30kDa subunit domain-containing protein n=1 Tax=Agathobacter ruminis TaxID=1712665 RepID=A0A2G3E396_9FIRM|nr:MULTISPECIES: NADH-quinone oxidoreductase subunit C [Agathobacter]MBQ1681869.1 NADH-quinone oxidoreductase subunit C [Agathobacter sp.]MCR5676927.1 NADH-quinone oxidoreductase subunit C [Agathobacter sp.]MDC7302286.1 NADH-quinone oxidoreductase subunit C [Agathobacter ruminis]PHU37583.1 hypothetical protein CSX02_07080 [Agathobacter ruminis]